MIGICNKCGNYDWDKEVNGNVIKCPKCGDAWEFKKLPMFVLTGCSGIGKTTTAQLLQRRCTDVVTLDADIFYNLMEHETEQDGYDQLEQMWSISKNITQSGKPVLWTMAGNLEKINHTYNARFFDKIHVLALVASEDDVRQRMEKGRGITDQNWIQGSVDYNNYFRTHNSHGDTTFEVVDTEGKSVEDVAKEVMSWIQARL